ncbi:hypothetical protein ACHAPU_010071 [Fusarium lateritium]
MNTKNEPGQPSQPSQPDFKVTKEFVRRSFTHPHSRLPKTVIRSSEELIPSEYHRLLDLAQAWIGFKFKKTAGISSESTSENQTKIFFEKIFDGWTSMNRSVRIPGFPVKNEWDSTIEVGSWKWNLLDSPSKLKPKREQEEKGNSVTATSANKTEREEARKKGQPAFLSLELTVGHSEPKLSFDFKDGNGQHASVDDVQFHRGMNHVAARAECIVYHDNQQKERARKRNLKFIVALAHLRIIRWAASGNDGGPAVPIFGYRLGGLIEPILAFPYFDQILNDMIKFGTRPAIETAKPFTWRINGQTSTGLRGIAGRRDSTE